MNLGFWLSFLVAWICCGVVVACLLVRRMRRVDESEAKFWAQLHDPPPTVRKRPR
jgi:hypothetical protein